MVNKEEILAIKASMNEIQETIYDLDNKKRVKAEELLDKVLSCKEILTETQWELQGDTALISKDTQHKMLFEFLQSDHHCHYENKDVFLHFDDWDVSLVFKTTEGLLTFIEKFGIVLKVDSLKRQLETDKRRLKRLEDEIERIEKLNKGTEKKT